MKIACHGLDKNNHHEEKTYFVDNLPFRLILKKKPVISKVFVDDTQYYRRELNLIPEFLTHVIVLCRPDFYWKKKRKMVLPKCRIMT